MTSYYLRADADSGGDGTTSNDLSSDGTHAWNSIAQMRAQDYSSGDIVNIRAGDTFDDAYFILNGITGIVDGLTFQGADFGGKTIALDGKPWFDHDTIFTKVNYNGYDLSNVTLKDLNMSGLGVTTGKSTNVSFSDTTGLVLDGLYIQGDYGTPLTNNVGQNGIHVAASCSGTIEVKNCEIFNVHPTDASGNLLPNATGVDCIGLNCHGMASATVYIHDNIIHDCNGDGIMLYLNSPANSMMTYVYNNSIYDCGEDLIDLKGFSNVEIYNNEFYRDTYTGGGGSSGATMSDAVSINNSGYLTVTHENVIIRDNDFYDFYDHGAMIVFSSGVNEPYTDVQIYRNTFDNTNLVFYILGTTGSFVFSHNFIINPRESSIYRNSANTGGKIVNNTIIYGPLGTAEHAFNLRHTGGDIIRNNLIEWNHARGAFFWLGSGTEPVVDHNIWHNAGSTTKVEWDGTTYNESNWDTWTSSHTGDSYADPEVLTTGVLESTSPAIDAGVIVAGVNDVGILDLWDNSTDDTPNIGADLGSEQGVISIDAGFTFNEASYNIKVQEI